MGNTQEAPRHHFVLPEKNSYFGVRCVVVGDGLVGKTSLLRRIVLGYFDKTQLMTLKEAFQYEIKFQNIDVDVILTDTPGQDDYDRLRVCCYPSTDIFIITFSFDLPNSFDRVKSKWIPEVRRHCPSAIVLLVGLKLDLVVQVVNEHTDVPVDCVVCGPALALAVEVGAVDYLETSALTGYGIKELREAIVAAVLSPASRIHSRLARNVCGLQQSFSSQCEVLLQGCLPTLSKDLVHVVAEYGGSLDYLHGMESDLPNALVSDCVQFRSALEGRKWQIKKEMSRAQAKDLRFLSQRTHFIQARIKSQSPRPAPSSNSKCVSGDGIVHMADDSVKRMSNLQVGDRVKTAVSLSTGTSSHLHRPANFATAAQLSPFCLEDESSSNLIDIEFATVIQTFFSFHSEPLSLVRFRNLTLTRCHPIVVSSPDGLLWMHPEELCTPERVPCSVLVNVALDHGHSLIVDGFIVATLGANVGARLKDRRPDLDQQFGIGWQLKTD